MLLLTFSLRCTRPSWNERLWPAVVLLALLRCSQLKLEESTCTFRHADQRREASQRLHRDIASAWAGRFTKIHIWSTPNPVVDIGTVCAALGKAAHALTPIEIVDTLWHFSLRSYLPNHNISWEADYSFVYLLWHWTGEWLGQESSDVTQLLGQLSLHWAALFQWYELYPHLSQLEHENQEGIVSIQHGVVWGSLRNLDLNSSFWTAAQKLCNTTLIPHCRNAVGHAVYYSRLRAVPNLSRLGTCSQLALRSFRIPDNHFKEILDFCNTAPTEDYTVGCMWGAKHSYTLYLPNHMQPMPSLSLNLRDKWLRYNKNWRIPLGLDFSGTRKAVDYAVRSYDRMVSHKVITYLPSSKTTLVPNVRLSDGNVMPMIAFGTGVVVNNMAADNPLNRLRIALILGYRHIDVGDTYPLFDEIHTELQKFSRRLLFITVKVDLTLPERRLRCMKTGAGCFQMTIDAVYSALNSLRLDYVNLLLLHRPPLRDDSSTEANEEQCLRVTEQWRAVEQIKQSGVAISVGVSNFCLPLLQCLLLSGKTPTVMQQMHHVGMGLDPNGLVSWARHYGAVYMAYSALLGGGQDAMVGMNPRALRSIGAAHRSEVAEIALRWVAQQGIPLVTSAKSETHLASNLHLFNEEKLYLSSLEMHRLSAVADPSTYAKLLSSWKIRLADTAFKNLSLKEWRPAFWGDCDSTSWFSSSFMHGPPGCPLVDGRA